MKIDFKTKISNPLKEYHIKEEKSERNWKVLLINGKIENGMSCK